MTAPRRDWPKPTRLLPLGLLAALAACAPGPARLGTAYGYGAPAYPAPSYGYGYGYGHHYRGRPPFWSRPAPRYDAYRGLPPGPGFHPRQNWAAPRPPPPSPRPGPHPVPATPEGMGLRVPPGPLFGR